MEEWIIHFPMLSIKKKKKRKQTSLYLTAIKQSALIPGAVKKSQPKAEKLHSLVCTCFWFCFFSASFFFGEENQLSCFCV